MSGPKAAPLLCRWGLHAWRFLEAKPSRLVGLDVVRDRRDRCQRCGLTMRREKGPVPGRRVRIWQDRSQRGSSSLAAVLPPLVTALLLVLSVAYREQVRTLVWLTPLALLLLAVVVGCVWLAGRLTARPPMTEHLRDEAAVLIERSK